MTLFRRRIPLARRWLYAIIALVATTAQLAVALAPLVERERSMASHVESQGGKGHYAHDETKCASCQARTIHGNAPRPEPPRIVERLIASTLQSRVDRAVSGQLDSQSSPRAPPVVI